MSSRYPDVAVEAQVRRQWPAAALVELSESSDLVVLGRHHSGWPEHLGSLARAVIREARCPVMVVPVGYTEND